MSLICWFGNRTTGACAHRDASLLLAGCAGSAYGGRNIVLFMQRQRLAIIVRLVAFWRRALVATGGGGQGSRSQ